MESIAIFSASVSVALRLGNPFGPGQSSVRHFGAVTTFARNALEGQPIVIHGDGGVVRDYIHVSDVVAAILAAGRIVDAPPVLNIGAGEGHSLKEIVGIITDLVPEPPKIIFRPARGFDVPVSILDSTLAASALNWRPKLTFREGVASLMAALAEERVKAPR